MEFEVDVSGEDLLSKNYTICIANKDSIIKGFKFNEDIVHVLSSRYGQGQYRYQKSKKGKALFKVRLYSIVIYYLFKSLNLSHEISLKICRDFNGRESEIKGNLNFFLEKLLGLKITKLHFDKLSSESNAHRYSFLMRHDTKDQMKTYIKIDLGDMERWLKK